MLIFGGGSQFGIHVKEFTMSSLCINYPDAVLVSFNESREHFETEARIALAMKLFDLGRLTSGQAAEMAGLSRVEFLLTCRKYGSTSVQNAGSKIWGVNR